MSWLETYNYNIRIIKKQFYDYLYQINCVLEIRVFMIYITVGFGMAQPIYLLG
jgi:hypothetical protein